MKKSTLFFLLAMPLTAFAQNFTYNWGADTSATALCLYEKDNKLLILANIADFEPGNDIPIAGEINIGTGIAQFDLSTSKFCSHHTLNTLFPSETPTALIRGAIPTQSFAVINNDYFVPSSSYRGWLPIDNSPNSSISKSFGKQICHFTKDFEIENKNLSQDDQFARNDIIKNTFVLDQSIMVVSEDQNDMSSNVAVYNDEIEMEFEKQFSSDVQFSNWQIYDSTLVYALSHENIYVFDKYINQIEILPYVQDQNINGLLKFEVNDNHILIVKQGVDANFNHASSLQILDRKTGETQSTVFKPNYKIFTAKIINDKIIIVFDLRSQGDLPKDYETPIGFEVLDINLQILDEEEIGHSYATPVDIEYLDNGQVAILGYINNNWEFENTRSENEIYLWIGNVPSISADVNSNPQYLQSKIFPNPAHDWITIEFNADRLVKNISSQLEVYAMTGQNVGTQKLSSIRGNRKSIQVDFSSYSPGVYNLILRQGAEVYTLGKVSKI